MPSNEKRITDHLEYTKNDIPLEIICRKRYAEAKRRHRDQFRKDIEDFCLLQPNALAGVRLQRMFCVGIKIPKLEKYLSPEEERRLEKILITPNPQ